MLVWSRTATQRIPIGALLYSTAVHVVASVRSARVRKTRAQPEALRVDSTRGQRQEGIAGWEREHTSAGTPVVRVGSFDLCSL
jgi:hypothetical protein